ncbi:site-specific integrase [Streptomyces cellulosae]|uniref:site-specific integrase n=1 Tax=Streptomyces cellulosae TaxID=1968 RepID=UPI0004CC74D8|nr:site-specific integrase [Streptomyces cellulosae]
MSGKRGNGEGSIYPYKNGYAAYVWVTKPDGKRARKYAYGKTREEVHEKWLNLHAEAKKGPVTTRHRTVAAFLTYWLDSLVKVPKPRRRRIKPWSVAEASQFLTDAAARDDHLVAAWVLVLCLGLRRGEVLGLTWKSVDFERGELYVDHQIQRAGREILHRETKTEDSDDFLPLPALCLKALRMRRAQQIGDQKAAGELWRGSHDLNFTTKYGTPIEPGNMTRMFALRARRAGLRVIPLRNTRHTCSSLLVALKVHPKVAQRILRHSQIAMTMEVYAEASEEEVRAAIGQLSDAMGGTG